MRMKAKSARLLAAKNQPAAYHLISRIVDRRLVLGEAEREKFVALTKALATFCGIDVFAWCIMGNHFHLLAEIQPGDPAALPDDAFLARLRALWSPARMREFQALWDKAASPDARRALRAPHEKLMGSLPAFMQALKQRFSVWFNRKHERAGTLWESRYKSVIIDPEPSVLRVLAAYIDLNPVRAGLVADPKDWHWSGYGAAMGGDAWSRRGLANLFKEGGLEISAENLAAYRLMLFETGSEERLEAGKTPENRQGIEVGKVAEVKIRKGKLTMGEALRCRVGYFTRGGVVGRRAFVDGMFTALRERFPEGRKSGARDLRDIDGGDLCSLRALREGIKGTTGR
jgi:putative transposase